MARRALVSVSDKRGLEELGRGLKELGYSILSTGGTAKALEAAGIEVDRVADYTGFPEILGGRVKSLHPKIFGGLLARSTEDDVYELADHDIDPIKVVVCNLYPFKKTVETEGVDLAAAVEKIDIGGPSMIRAAAKNAERVIVVTDPDDYPAVLEAMRAGSMDTATRYLLAVKAFRHTAAYDATIAAHLPRFLEDEGQPSGPGLIAAALMSAEEEGLRYGENPHQSATVVDLGGGGLAGCTKIRGKALSFNNYNDASGAWLIAADLPTAGCVVVKHANPCGVALGEDMEAAFRAARSTDPVSAFGGVIAANRPVGEGFARAVIEAFAEVVMAPAFDEAAIKVFKKKKNLRILQVGDAAAQLPTIRSIDGGFLIQDRDLGWDREQRKVVTETAPDDAQMAALELAWRVAKHTSSNAIVIGGADLILGVGAGQMSRVDAARIAVEKARAFEHPLDGSVAASDAFFPFADGVEALAEAGVKAIIQPGGSVRDDEVIAACDRLGMAMVFTGHRHFRH